MGNLKLSQHISRRYNEELEDIRSRVLAMGGLVEEQLKQAAILASFIPVVMAMAGNAGIQASTVTVQGLAAGNLWIGDLGGRVVKELMGSLINGALIAVALTWAVGGIPWWLAVPILALGVLALVQRVQAGRR